MVRFVPCGIRSFDIPRGVESDGATYLIKRSMLLTEFDNPHVYDSIIEIEKAARLKLELLYRLRELVQNRRKETEDSLKSLEQKHISLDMKIRKKLAKESKKYTEEKKKYLDILEGQKSDLRASKHLKGIAYVSDVAGEVIFAHAHIMVGRRTRGGFSCYLHRINKMWRLTENGLEDLGENIIKKYNHTSFINPTVVETETVDDGYRLLIDNLTFTHSRSKISNEIPVLVSEMRHLQSLNKLRAKNIKKINRMIDIIKQGAIEIIRTSFH